MRRERAFTIQGGGLPGELRCHVVVGFPELLLTSGVGEPTERQQRMVRRISGNAWHLVDRIESMSSRRTDAG